MLQLRGATDADAPAVADVLIAARRVIPEVRWAHDDEDLRGWVQSTLIPRGGVTVAVDQGRIVGVLAVARQADTAWIEQLSVDPRQLRSGVGGTLLRHALATLPRPLRLWTFQPNTNARVFYEHHGFVAVRFTDGVENEERFPDVLYERAQP